jgi:hypothetical protein
MPDQGRPFRVLGVQQIAIGALDREKLRHFWCDLLGVDQHGTYQSAAENVVEDILRVGPASAPIEIDLMQPLGRRFASGLRLARGAWGPLCAWWYSPWRGRS